MTAKLQNIIEELDRLSIEELSRVVLALEKKLNLAKQLTLNDN